MEQQNTNQDTISDIKGILRYVKFLAVLCIILLIVVPILLHVNAGRLPSVENEEKNSTAETAILTDNFQIPPFDDTEEGRMAEYGYRLITETYALIGPGTALAITGNRLACSSCHLEGGTKPYAAPYVGLSGIFPMYSGREDRVGSLEERINGCFERSMNGKAIDVNSKEMRAMMSYIKHISKDAPVGNRIKGQGFVDFVAPDRPADIEKGALVYKNTCLSCHGANGEGIKG